MIIENTTFEKFKLECSRTRSEFEQSEITYGFVFTDHYEKSRTYIQYYLVSTAQARVLTYWYEKNEISITFIALAEVKQIAQMLQSLSF